MRKTNTVLGLHEHTVERERQLGAIAMQVMSSVLGWGWSGSPLMAGPWLFAGLIFLTSSLAHCVPHHRSPDYFLNMPASSCQPLFCGNVLVLAVHRPGIVFPQIRQSCSLCLSHLRAVFWNCPVSKSSPTFCSSFAYDSASFYFLWYLLHLTF